MSKPRKPPEDRGRHGGGDPGDEELALEGLEEEGPEMEPLTSAEEGQNDPDSGELDSVSGAGQSSAPNPPRQADLLEGSEGAGEPLPEFRLVPHTFEWADPEGWEESPQVSAPDAEALELQGLETEDSFPPESLAEETQETREARETDSGRGVSEETASEEPEEPPEEMEEPEAPEELTQEREALTREPVETHSGVPGDQGDVFGPPDDAPAPTGGQAASPGPDPVLARLAIARDLWVEGEHQAALDNLDAAVAEAPERLEVLLELGATLGYLGRYDDADVYLRRAQRLAPGDVSVAAQLGIILFRRGLYAAAEQELRGVTERDAAQAEAHFYRGEALNRLGRSDEALDVLLRAVELDPDNARAYQVMGMIYDRKRMPELATAMYRKARELGSR